MTCQSDIETKAETTAEALSAHALARMVSRRISERAVEAVLEYGRIIHVRGAEIYALGRKEVARFARYDVDLAAYEGIQVVCSPSGTIVTVYRNRSFRGLRPRSRASRRAA